MKRVFLELSQFTLHCVKYILQLLQLHIGLKRKIQRLLKVNFVHRNFIRQDLQKVRQSRATNRVSGAATIKSFQFPSTLATPSHPKFSKEHPNWKFWACVQRKKG